MRKNRTLTRPLAALLALVMALTLTPAAAAAGGCTANSGGAHTVSQWETVVEADCSTVGVRRGYCTACKQTVYDETGYDRDNHAANCDDNGDGTHSGVCTNHTTPVTISRETHHYINGVCKQCGALDYEDVVLNLESNRTVHVAVGDANAKLTAGDIKITLNKTDITDNYDLSYMWQYRGSTVGAGSEFALPASVYDNDGIYYYTLVVSADPRGNTSRPPLNKLCTIAVQVEELVTASAIITTQVDVLRMDDLDSWSADSVSAQIYDAVQDLCAKREDPSYVVFTDLPASDVGSLDAVKDVKYYFDPTAGSKALDDVKFLRGTASGDYVVSFTAYDTAKESYSGLLTFTVQQYVGNMDVLFTTGRDKPVTLSSEEFEAFWEKICPGGVLESISFDETPKAVEGMLYVDYISANLPGSRVRYGDEFYVEPGRNEYGIDAVTFIPGSKQSDYVTLDFTATGIRNGGRSPIHRSGTMYIFLSSDGRSADVTVAASAGGTALPAESFQKAYQSATGGTGSSFYIQLLEVPESGDLYVGRTANRNGTRLTAANIQGRPFSYSDSRGETISSLTYLPGKAASESIRYVASSAQGKPLYAGKIIFTTSGAAVDPADPSTPSTSEMTVEYTCDASGVVFKGSSFETLPGENAAKLTMVSFTPPSPAFGTLYYGRTAANTGTAITSDSIWFSVASTVVAANSMVMDNVSFVPAAGYTGTITIPFTAINTDTNRSAGSVRITVSAAVTTPTTPTDPGTTTPDVTTYPVKTFPDVQPDDWFYPYVTDLTTSGVLGGYPDGTFRPSEGVNLGQALKMIMIAVGYPEQPQTGTHWASGYLSKAKEDNLLPANTVEDLDRRISRYTIAEIAARALKLSPVAVTTSPFADMSPAVSSAPYVMALYNVQILTGSVDSATGALNYNGTIAIRRKEFSAIIWRVQNYARTGNANTVAGTTAVG